MTADTGDGRTWMERLREAAGSGEPVDLDPGVAEDESHPPDASETVSARQLPAEDIRALLLEPGLRTDPRGLQVRGALVTGTLDLDHANVPCRLVFTHCRFENIPSFEHSTLPGLVFEGVALPGLSLYSARLTGDADLTGLRSSGEVTAQNIHVGGQLVLTGAKLNDPDGVALSLDGADITGDTLLDGLETTGEIVALGVHIGGQLLLTGAKLSNPDGTALSLDGADITGGAFLDGLEATGEVRAPGSHIGSQLVLTGAKLSNPDGTALNLDRAEITGGAFLDGLEATGEVQAAGSRIGSELSLTGAKLSNPDGTALNLSAAEITGAAFLDGLEATGEVRAAGSRIGGRLKLTGAKLSNPDGTALTLEGAEITGAAFLKGLEATGEVRALWARIGIQLLLTGAKLSNPDGTALSLDGAEITGGAFLEGLEATGAVRAPGAHIGSQLVLAGAKLSNTGGNALDLSAATLDTLILDDAFAAEGRTDLSFVSIRILRVGMKKPDNGLPPLSSAQGWTLGTIHGFLRTDRRSARAWLDTIDIRPRTGGRKEFASQPWKEMAKIYDQIGQPEDARQLRFCAARRTTRVAPRTSKLVRWPYAALVGYGYYPLIVFGWLAALWLTVLVLCTLNAPDFIPTEARASTVTITTNSRSEEVRVTGATPPPPNYPQFDPRLFAMDTALPAAATGQTNAWRITGNTRLSLIFAAIKGFAWLLTALLLAGITGILRKD